MFLLKKTPVALILTFAFLFALNSVVAQSANLKPNIVLDEFTAKGASFGFSEGSEVPNAFFNDVYSKKFSLYDLLDKPVVIELFSLNGELNAKNKKYLAAFYRQYNINIIGICTDQYPNEIMKRTKAWGATWSNVMDDNKRFGGLSFAEMNNIPTAKFIVIYPDKKVAKVFKSESDIGKVAVTLQQYFN